MRNAHPNPNPHPHPKPKPSQCPSPSPLPPALARCDFLLKSASAVAEFALWVTPSLQGRHLDLQVSDRFASQTLPAWTRRLGPPPTVADLFCERLHEACANETAYMYRGRRYCHHCNAKGSTY